jgi:hypothetical protein
MLKHHGNVGAKSTPALLVVLAASMVASRGAVDISDVYSGNGNSFSVQHDISAYTSGPVFDSGSGSGNIGAVSLAMYFANGYTTDLNVSIETFNPSGSVYGSPTVLGYINPASTGTTEALGELYNVNLTTTYSLAANLDYALVITTPAGDSSSDKVGFVTTGESVHSANFEGLGSYVGADFGNSSGSAPLQNLYFSGFEVDVVPESSHTGIVMGFGVLAIAAGSLRGKLLRRKPATFARV